MSCAKASPVSLLVDAPERAGWLGGQPARSHACCAGTAREPSFGSSPAPMISSSCGAALQTGPVHEFARQLPTLTELFRHVVHVEETPELAGSAA